MSDIEDAFSAAQTSSTPFIADIDLPAPVLQAATAIVRRARLNIWFERSPTLAVRVVLYPLPRDCGAKTSDVYLHIGEFVGENYFDMVSRDALKSDFRRAARKTGLPVHGNEPSSLFFAPWSPLAPAKTTWRKPLLMRPSKPDRPRGYFRRAQLAAARGGRAMLQFTAAQGNRVFRHISALRTRHWRTKHPLKRVERLSNLAAPRTTTARRLFVKQITRGRLPKTDPKVMKLRPANSRYE